MGLDDIFGHLYTIFGLEDIYGSEPGELADYLWGTASSQVTTNQFVGIGFITLGITAFVFLGYYYFLGQIMQKPSWGNKFTWLLALAVNSVLAFVAGWQWTLSDYYQGKMVTISAVTKVEEALPIDGLNCLQFGGVNALIAILFFVAFCLFFKWWSRDYSHIPF